MVVYFGLTWYRFSIFCSNFWKSTILHVTLQIQKIQKKSAQIGNLWIYSHMTPLSPKTKRKTNLRFKNQNWNKSERWGVLQGSFVNILNSYLCQTKGTKKSIHNILRKFSHWLNSHFALFNGFFHTFNNSC